MGRRSAAKDASIWHDIVLAWCERTWAPQGRFLNELEIHIQRAREGDVNSAKGLIAYFYFNSRSGKTIDSRVLQFMEDARQRYSADPKRKIDKALLLVRPKRGNPGGVQEKRRMTPEAHVDAGQEIIELQSKGWKEEAAISKVKTEWNVSERTVRKAAADQRQIVRRGTGKKLNPE